MSTVRETAPDGTLTIELEDAATRHGWISTLGLLARAMPQWHFVGTVGHETLASLRTQIEVDGWVVSGHGDQTWQDHYRPQAG